MIKKFFLLIKKFILGILFLYTYNILVYPINAVIPINFINTILVTFFGFPAMIGLCLFSFLMF